MASETSAVFVAVRVRPFTAREDPAECTVTIPSDKIVNITDLGSGAQHSYTFDKIFWSVPPEVLPMKPTLELMRRFNMMGAGSSSSGIGASVNPSRSSSLLVKREAEVASPALTPRFSADFSELPAGLNRKSRRNSVGTSCHPGNGSSIGGSGTGSSCSATGLSSPSSLSLERLPCLMQTRDYDDQESLYDFIGPRLYKPVMAGFNSCLFAYGQTGSGKTHSMIGPPEHIFAKTHGEQGIMPRLCTDLFDMMKEERDEDEGVTFNVECCFMEIYCEKVRDLLPQTHSVVAAVAAAAARDATLSSRGGEGPSNAGPTPPTTSRRRNDSTSLYGSSAASAPGSPCGALRIRQHPSRGPYVEGLSMVKVRDAQSVLRLLGHGLRERATAETKMNEHSSRSHAIFQLHITKVTVVREESGVVTKTRVCKVNMVDLAGSERVTQSGAVGDRFEEARNINLSLSTLGRVIQQLSEKQSGKHAIPAYRDSALTWLLSDSLGGNSKTMMLATIAPSAYCYHQTLNTLRFAGIAKKIINVATVNEDKHFQKLIADLRQHIVKLTLQLEEGKASDVHSEEIELLRKEKRELEGQVETLRARLAAATPPEEVAVLRKRIRQLEEDNASVHAERTELQRISSSSMASLREELAQKRGEVLGLRESLAKKEEEIRDLNRRHKEGAVWRSTVPEAVASGKRVGAALSSKPTIAVAVSGTHAARLGTLAHPQQAASVAEVQAWKDSLATLERQLTDARQDLQVQRQRREEAERARVSAVTQCSAAQKEAAELRAQLEEFQARVDEGGHRLQATNRELLATKEQLALLSGSASRANRETSLLQQLERARSDYLQEKQGNVDLLVRVAHLERQVLHMRNEAKNKCSDVHELEQLLLEETEMSERYYLRIRLMRSLVDIQRVFVKDIMRCTHPDTSEASPKAMARLAGSPRLSAVSWLLRNEKEDDRRFVARMDSSDEIAAMTRQELELQECTTDEAFDRLLLEQNYLETVIESLGQHLLLRRWEIENLNDTVGALKADLRLRGGDGRVAEQRIADYVTQVETKDAEALALRMALASAHDESERLQEQVAVLTEKFESQERSHDLLVRKVAEIQTECEELRVRCAEAEHIASQMQDAATSSEAELAQKLLVQYRLRNMEATGDSFGGSTSVPGRGTSPSGSATAINTAQASEDQREEIGRLNALLEKERHEKHEKARAWQRESEQHAQLLQEAVEAKRKAAQENATLAKNYQTRISQLSDAIKGLEDELRQEVAITDQCRTRASKADAEREIAQQTVQRVTKERDDLLRAKGAVEAKIASLQDTLAELKEAYSSLENRLRGCEFSEPKMYLTLDLSKDNDDWLERAEREREGLLKQKMEARRLNEELLEHVRRRNESLRDVHRQINRLRGEMSPDERAPRSQSRDPFERQLPD